MHDLTAQWSKALLAAVIAAGLTAGCTRYNATTGQNEIDYGATAGLAGAAMGAAALGVALSNNNNDRYYYGGPGYNGGNRGHNTVNVDRNINVNNQKVNSVNRVNKSNRVNAAKVNKSNRVNANKVNRANRRGTAKPRPNAGNRGGRRAR
jgi:hypothetical protein